MPKVIQYHSSVIEADAIGNSIWTLTENLEALGIDSLVCVADGENKSKAPGVFPASGILSANIGKSLSEDDVLLLHYSFYDEVIERLAHLPLRKIIVYHNVTPAEFFAEIDRYDLAVACSASREQLRRMAPLFDAAVGVSDYNSAELRDAGYNDVSTIPILLDLDRFGDGNDIDLSLVRRLQAGADVNILFVGRFVPNKRIERVISAISHFQKAFSLTIRLHLVGKVWDQPYFASLFRYASEVDVASSIRCHIAVDPLYLRSIYAAADAFVCMSDHEGFMVPILEAFAAACPVVALDRGAVGETMGGAGLLISEPDPELVAGLIYRLKTDSDLRLRIISGQGRRATAFRPQRTTQKWLTKLGDNSSQIRSMLKRNMADRYIPTRAATQ